MEFSLYAKSGQNLHCLVVVQGLNVKLLLYYKYSQKRDQLGNMGVLGTIVLNGWLGGAKFSGFLILFLDVPPSSEFGSFDQT